MPKDTADYDRASAVAYAHRWAYSRNPAYYNYDGIGGDCTNFISQCIYAGARVMNYDQTYGWYYISANHKAPSWSGVPFLRNFLVSNAEGPGPRAAEAAIGELLPGDVIQLSFEGKAFQHSLLVVSAGAVPDRDNILVATHTDDSDYRPLNSYDYQNIRFLHILHVRR
ncbi:Putative amidase domain-containing protein [Sporobacter termitidis DSM 10068]|uniref:Putative amidase domain-containing protein n=1 Tax=Sporobacter termitidis DSM 10068 TaxID=1123282 RepID=A0A1M5YK67_9FIRM|nr:amidase domain-containing protein [Sporobacter termitidis]SHI12268.1 Putative amidase domain-containing protein [Sporobacter termitidis DSM 10068]